MAEAGEQLIRTRLEGVMGINYDACSIIAAEASKEASELLAGRTIERSLYVFDDSAGSSPNRLKTKPVTSLDGIEFPYSDNNTVSLVLAKPKKEKQANERPDPQLLAIVRDDLTVPIATFARRKAGTCSYVQLGQEMTDEDFVVTPYDKRKNLVDAIRTILRGKQDYDKESLTDFVNTELNKNLEAIQPQLEAALCRRVSRLYQGSKHNTRPLWILTKEGSLLQSLQTTPLGNSGVVLPGGRQAELLLANQSPVKRLRTRQEVQGIQLLAVTRGNVALPLTSFSDENAVNIQTEKPINSEELEHVRSLILQEPSEKANSLHLAERSFSSKRLVRAVHRAALSYHLTDARINRGATKAVVEQLAPERATGLVKRYYSKESYEKMARVLTPNGKATYQEFMTVWGTAWGKPRNKGLYNQVEKLRNLAEVRRSYEDELKRPNSTTENLLLATAADKLFTEYLGEYDPAADKLIVELGRLASHGANFTGHMQRVQINADTGDIDLFAHITQAPGGQSFTFSLEGRPTGLSDFDTATIFPEQTVTKTQKLEIAAQDVNELRRLLGALSIR